MPDACPLIPPAQVVRERLGQTVRETRMLRRLLDLAVKADEERARKNISSGAEMAVTS